MTVEVKKRRFGARKKGVLIWHNEKECLFRLTYVSGNSVFGTIEKVEFFSFLQKFSYCHGRPKRNVTKVGVLPTHPPETS